MVFAATANDKYLKSYVFIMQGLTKVSRRISLEERQGGYVAELRRPGRAPRYFNVEVPIDSPHKPSRHGLDWYNGTSPRDGGHHIKLIISEMPDGRKGSSARPSAMQYTDEMPMRSRLSSLRYPNVVSKISNKPLESEIKDHVWILAQVSDLGLAEDFMMETSYKAAAMSMKALELLVRGKEKVVERLPEAFAAGSQKALVLLMRGKETVTRQTKRYSAKFAEFLRK